MMIWPRAMNGMATNAQWLAVARRSGQPVAVVVSVAWALMDHAAQAPEHGSVAEFRAEDVAAFLGVEDEAVQTVIDCLEARDWIREGRIAEWDEWQAQSDDRQAASSRERVRRHRERKKAQGAEAAEAGHADPVSETDETPAQTFETACNVTETRCNANETRVTRDETAKR